MTKHEKEILKELTKEQLVFLIENMEHSLTLISTVCVEESKKHIESNAAIRKIREYIYIMPSANDVKEISTYIDTKL